MSEEGLIYLLWSDLVGLTRARGVPLGDYARRQEAGLCWAKPRRIEAFFGAA